MPSSPSMKKPGLDFSSLDTPNPFQDQCVPSPGDDDNGNEQSRISPGSDKGPLLERSPSPKLRQSSSVEFDGAGPRYERLYRMSMEIAAKKENLRRSLTESIGFEPKGMADGLRGSRPSSAFVSKAKSREIFQARDGPSPGNYEIPGFGDEIAKSATRISSVFSSTTLRLASPKNNSPGIGTYESGNFHTIGSVRGGKMVSLSQRFGDDQTVAPGPGAYELPDNKSPTSHSPSSVFASKSKARDLPVYVIETPPPGSYDVDSFIESERKKKRGATAFASKSPRVQEVAKLDSVAVGAYDVFDPMKSTTFAANIYSNAERFPDPKKVAPGPGQYEVPDIKKKQVYGPSSAFSSKTKARDLPVGQVDTPAPLAYNLEGMAEKVEKKRPSSAFTSKSPRMAEARQDTPPVGAYEVAVVTLKKSGGVNMSAKTTERFPDPRKSTNGPFSEYKPLEEEKAAFRKVRSVTTAAS